MIWVDLDNTLIFVRDAHEEKSRTVLAPFYGHSPDLILRPPRKGRRKLQRIVVQGVEFQGCVRRDAHEFLEALRQLAEVRLLTSATRAYALAINTAFRLGFGDDQIYAREDWLKGKQPSDTGADPEGILIDNRSGGHYTSYKLIYLGQHNRLILVEDFDGHVQDGFTKKWPEYVREIQRLLGESNAETQARQKAENDALQVKLANMQPSISPMAMLLEQKAIERRRRAKQRLCKKAAKAALQNTEQLSKMLAEVDTPEGRRRALAEIHRFKGAIYGTDPANPGVIIEVLPDGTRRRGKFVNRRFMPLAE